MLCCYAWLSTAQEAKYWPLNSRSRHSVLNNAHPDFYSFGLSAVNLSKDILVGRPFGGTTILYRKYLANKIKILDSNESRITCIQIDTNIGLLLLLNVYMPTNYGDDASLESYIDCLSKLHVLMVESDCAHTLIVGDFNCGPGSRFFNEFSEFAADNNLCMSDISRLQNVFTYYSDDGTKMSWVDHILSTSIIDGLVNNINILNNVIVSDHKPLSFSLNCLDCTLVNSSNMLHCDRSNNSYYSMPCWNKCDDNRLVDYSEYLDMLLQNVNIPFDALFSDNKAKVMHTVIDKFYDDICGCINNAVSYVVPVRKCSYSDFNVPGWNTYVDEKHDLAREAFLEWVMLGKPRQGLLFERMKRTRATFKLALRYCRNNVEQLKADACADALFDKDPRKFWNNVYKVSNSRATNHATSVGAVIGERDVADMWKSHFQQLYSSGIDSKYSKIFEQKLAQLAVNDSVPVVTIHDVCNALLNQKRDKAAGPDGIQMEALLYSGPRLRLYLSILFNLFLLYGYVPDRFVAATIVPLVKCKTGDLTDVNNYRAIALSNSITKILESILFDFIQLDDLTDSYQFGFTKHSSTTICTNVFKKTVDYYRMHGSHVFTCFIDFKKAFDSVDYWLLFCKMLEKNQSNVFILSTRLLSCWYGSQTMTVRWHNVTSQSFSMFNGVRQGGILSPYLFRFYIRSLISKVTGLNIGCNIGGYFVNLLAYADDMVLIAPSWHALQTLLYCVEDAAHEIKMTFNTDKTVCMIFNPYNKRHIIANSFPAFNLAGSDLLVVTQFKYLGHIIDNCLCDDIDINREMKCLFVRTNLMSRRFKRCSTQVKLRLFRTFCSCFYGIALWSKYSVQCINKFASCYIKCIKTFFGYAKYSSVTSMLLELGLPSFNTVVHNFSVSFNAQCIKCNSFIVNVMTSLCV